VAAAGPVDTFIAIANATAAIYQKCPPFATYHAHTALHFYLYDTSFDRDISVRMADQFAVVRDTRNGHESTGAPFPVSPNFESLAEYAIHGTIYPQGDLDLRIENLAPLTFRDVPTHADVIVRIVHGYHIEFASDASPELGHLILTITKAAAPSTHYLTDVYYNPATMLPTKIVAEGVNRMRMEAVYELVDGSWLLHTLAYVRVWNDGLTIEPTVVGAFLTTYENYQFSSAPPDPRLAKPAQ
jgi:hypothetical protein